MLMAQELLAFFPYIATACGHLGIGIESVKPLI